MKKILPVILILLLTINLFGCQSKKTSYNFKYKFKPEYSDKIRPGIASTFLTIVEDVVEIYDTALDDFEIQQIEGEFNEYAGKICLVYQQRRDEFNEDEKELLDVMDALWFNSSSLHLLKLYHEEDENNKSMGIKTEYDDEYYEENFEKLKNYIQEALDEAKQFID